MKNNNKRNIFFLTVLVGFLPLILYAEDRRVIPLDMYLIIDGSETLENSKNATFTWINEQVLDRFLMDEDRITIWAAGDRAELIYSGVISGAAVKNEIKDKIRTLDTKGKNADFSGALREVASGLRQTSQDRLSYTILITASAAGLGPALTGSDQGLFRWFRSKKYEQWQVLVVAPDIGGKVRQAAAAYMSR